MTQSPFRLVTGLVLHKIKNSTTGDHKDHYSTRAQTRVISHNQNSGLELPFCHTKTGLQIECLLPLSRLSQGQEQAESSTSTRKLQLRERAKE